MPRATKMTLNIQKVRDTGDMPAFIPLIHRHFEKACPQVASTKQALLVAPLDLMAYVVPDLLLAPIDSLEIIYGKRS